MVSSFACESFFSNKSISEFSATQSVGAIIIDEINNKGGSSKDQNNFINANVVNQFVA